MENCWKYFKKTNPQFHDNLREILYDELMWKSWVRKICEEYSTAEAFRATDKIQSDLSPWIHSVKYSQYSSKKKISIRQLLGFLCLRRGFHNWTLKSRISRFFLFFFLFWIKTLCKLFLPSAMRLVGVDQLGLQHTRHNVPTHNQFWENAGIFHFFFFFFFYSQWSRFETLFFSLEPDLKIQPITGVQNRESTYVFIMRGDTVLKIRTEIEWIFTQTHKTTHIMPIWTWMEILRLVEQTSRPHQTLKVILLFKIFSS